MRGPLFIFSFFIEHLNNVGQQMFFSLHTTSSAMYMRGSANRTELIRRALTYLHIGFFTPRKAFSKIHELKSNNDAVGCRLK